MKIYIKKKESNHLDSNNKMPGKKRDNELLNKMVEEYKVQLLDNYDNVKISGQSKIFFMCTSEGCVESVERFFKNIINYEGKFMCKYCIARKKVENKDTTKEKLRYDFDLLDKLCKENEVTLVEDYSKQKISSKSDIKINCKKCLNPFEKTFSKLIQNKIFLCKKCNYKKNFTEDAKVFDKDLLDSLVKEHNVILLDKYEKIKRDTIIHYECINNRCKEPFKKKIFTIFNFSGFYCDKCSTLNKSDRAKKTFIEKYGVSNPLKNKEVREKMKRTVFKKYGVHHVMHVKDIVNKLKETNLKKYGTTSTLYVTSVREKIHKTWIEKYGTIQYRNTKLYKDNFRNSIQQKYGVNTVLQLKSIREKIKQTNLKKYGVDNPTKNKSIYNKVVDTFKRKYNVINTSQNKFFFSKALKTMYSTKSYKMPSGKIIDVQGYEPYALNILFNEKVEEDDIITSRKDVPELWYTYKDDKYEHRHYVDIYIKSQNRCIEVKSTYTFSKDKEKVLTKQEYAKKEGYLYEIWVLGRKGNIIEKII